MVRFNDLAEGAMRSGRASVLVTFEDEHRCEVLDAIEARPGVTSCAFLGDVEGIGAAVALIPVVTDVRRFGNHIANSAASPIGVATNREHPTIPLEALIAVALEGLKIARNDSAPIAVHSEIYELATLHASKDPIALAPLTTSNSPQRANPEGDPLQADDPFAFMPADEQTITASSAATLTSGIAPVIESGTAAADAMASAQRDALVTAESGRIDERRIKKLVDQLEASEREISRLRDANAPDPGIPSAYRKVQGLSETEEKATVKKGFLDVLFHENVDESPRADQADGVSGGPFSELG